MVATAPHLLNHMLQPIQMVGAVGDDDVLPIAQRLPQQLPLHLARKPVRLLLLARAAQPTASFLEHGPSVRV